MCVSIIIPVYQVSEYIERCVRSVMEQTYTDLECIIVNDATEDDSIEKCEKLIEYYHGAIKFRIFHHERNRGLSAARNTGTKVATGEFIYYLDSDDELTIDCIEKLMSFVYVDDRIEMVQGSHLRISKDKEVSHQTDNISINGNEEARTRFLKTRQLNFAVWNKLIRKDFLLEHRLFFREDVIDEDLLWTFYLIKYLNRAYLCKDITHHYYIRPNSIITGSKKEIRGRNYTLIYDEILHHLTLGHEGSELKGLLYNFCFVLANFYRFSSELKPIVNQYRNLCWKYDCRFEAIIIYIVAFLSRYCNLHTFLLLLNNMRLKVGRF